MDFYPRIGGLLFEERHSPRLIAREVVIDDPPGRQYQRIFVIWFLSRREVSNGMEAGLAIREAKTLLVETRRARMLF